MRVLPTLALISAEAKTFAPWCSPLDKLHSNIYIYYKIQLVHADTHTIAPPRARHWTLRKLLLWRLCPGDITNWLCPGDITNLQRLSRPQVDLTFERFRFLAPCQRLRAIVCVLSAHLRRVLKSTCVCLRLREQCLRSEITSVSRVANVLLLRLVAGNMDLNTLASKRSQLIGNTAIVRKRGVIYKKSTCVCWRLSVAAFTQKRRDASFDLWPPLQLNSTVFSIWLVCPRSSRLATYD